MQKSFCQYHQSWGRAMSKYFWRVSSLASVKRPFLPRPFKSFLHLKTCPKPFLIVNNTFVLSFRLFWNISIFHGWKSLWITTTIEGAVIQVMSNYWQFEYFFRTHFFHCRGRAFVIQATLVSCLLFVVGMWIYCLYCQHSGTAFAAFE